MEKQIKDWKPIEANASVFNSFSEKLGFPLVDLRWYDVMSMEEEMWYALISQPVVAVVVAF